MDPTRLRTTRRLADLRAGRNDWYRIKAEADTPTQVMIYDEIGWFGVTAQDFLRDLDAIEGDLEVHLNTPGGEIFDGIAIYEALTQRPGQVRVIVDSLAASIGSVIAMGASPGQLAMARNANMMIHDGWGMCVGNAADMQETAALLNKMSDNIASIYAERTGQPAAQWRDTMRGEKWYSAQEAVDAGLADSVLARRDKTTADDKLTAVFDLSIFRNPPRAAMGQPYRPEPYQREAWENVQCPSCSKFNDDDAMYCGQCGTKLAGREDVTEEQPDDDPAARARTRTGVRNAADDVDHSDWDGPKAMSLAADSDDPATTYKQICAGRREGDPSLQKSWALPYKYPGKPPNEDGVRNALSRLPQTQGLTNEDEAKALLERLMKKINPDYEGGGDNHATELVFALDPAELRAAMTLKGAADQ